MEGPRAVGKPAARGALVPSLARRLALKSQPLSFLPFSQPGTWIVTGPLAFIAGLLLPLGFLAVKRARRQAAANRQQGMLPVGRLEAVSGEKRLELRGVEHVVTRRLGKDAAPDLSGGEAWLADGGGSVGIGTLWLTDRALVFRRRLSGGLLVIPVAFVRGISEREDPQGATTLVHWKRGEDLTLVSELRIPAEPPLRTQWYRLIEKFQDREHSRGFKPPGCGKNGETGRAGKRGERGNGESEETIGNWKLQIGN